MEVTISAETSVLYTSGYEVDIPDESAALTLITSTRRTCSYKDVTLRFSEGYWYVLQTTRK